MRLGDQDFADLSGLNKMCVKLHGRQRRLTRDGRAVMPQVRSAKVISTPPCTRPRRLWCLSSVTSAN